MTPEYSLRTFRTRSVDMNREEVQKITKASQVWRNLAQFIKIILSINTLSSNVVNPRSSAFEVDTSCIKGPLSGDSLITLRADQRPPFAHATTYVANWRPTKDVGNRAQERPESPRGHESSAISSDEFGLLDGPPLRFPFEWLPGRLAGETAARHVRYMQGEQPFLLNACPSASCPFDLDG